LKLFAQEGAAARGGQNIDPAAEKLLAIVFGGLGEGFVGDLEVQDVAKICFLCVRGSMWIYQWTLVISFFLVIGMWI
jgi:hypothetical protein